MTGVKEIPGKEAGVTLIETLVVVAIVAVMSAIVLPSFGSILEKMRLRNAAEALYSDLNYARSVALKTKQNIFLTVTPGTEGTWCWGIDTTTCDCTTAGSCQFEDGDVTTEFVKSGADFPGSSLPDAQVNFNTIGGSKAIVFEPRRGTTEWPANSGTFFGGDNVTAVFVSSSGNYSKGVQVSLLGRVSLTSDHYATD